LRYCQDPSAASQQGAWLSGRDDTRVASGQRCEELSLQSVPPRIQTKFCATRVEEDDAGTMKRTIIPVPGGAALCQRMFTRIGTETVPDSKTLGRLGRALGSKIVEQIHQRLVDIACQRHVVEGRRMRIDTTVTEVNIHYPTDSSLLGDGTRVLTRIMKQISDLVGEQGTRLRDRLRTIGHRVMEIARLSRSKGRNRKRRCKRNTGSWCGWHGRYGTRRSGSPRRSTAE